MVYVCIMIIMASSITYINILNVYSFVLDRSRTILSTYNLYANVYVNE